MSFIRNLFSAQGRVSRKQYWLSMVGFGLYAAFAVAMSLAVVYVYEKFFYTPQFNHMGSELNVRTPWVLMFGTLALLMALAVVPVFNVMIRRMHDRNHSARWLPIWIVLALVTILVRSLLDEPFRRSFFLDWWYVGTRYGWDVMVYGATMVLGGLPAIASFALKTYRNLTGWPVTQSVFALPVLLPLALYGVWYFIEAGFRRGTVGPNSYGSDPGRSGS